jgi:hypothetical protein
MDGTKHLLHALEGQLAALPGCIAPVALTTCGIGNVGAAIVENLRHHRARTHVGMI